MSKIFEQIQKLSNRSARELEILGDRKPSQGLHGLSPTLIREFRQLEISRENSRKQLIQQGWVKLQELGYQKISYAVNAAVASGHSDYDDPADRVSKYGVQCPDGSFIDGVASWQNAIVPALQHAGI